MLNATRNSWVVIKKFCSAKVSILPYFGAVLVIANENNCIWAVDLAE
jgi:hypothetical protein